MPIEIYFWFLFSNYCKYNGFNGRYWRRNCYFTLFIIPQLYTFADFLNYLMGVLSTSISSSISYYKKKLISNKIGIIISFSSVPGAYIGVFISKIFSLSEFKLYFAIILIVHHYI